MFPVKLYRSQRPFLHLDSSQNFHFLTLNRKRLAMNPEPIGRTPHYVSYATMMLFLIVVVSLMRCDQIRELIASGTDPEETLPQLKVFT